jgi:GntR family transcriptional regulator
MDLQVRLASFGEEMRRRGMEPSSRVLASEEVEASPDIADALDLLPGEQVFHLHRVRYADGEPMAIEQSWLPVRLTPGLFDDGAPASIYAELRRRGLEPDWGEDTVEACEVDTQDAELLGLRAGQAVLRLSRRTFAGEIACVYSRSSYRADRYVLWVPLRAPKRAVTPQASSVRQTGNGQPGAASESDFDPSIGGDPAMNGSGPQ